MTQICKTKNINGGVLSQNVVDNLFVMSIASSPQEVKDYFISIGNYDLYNSVVLFDIDTYCIYGYIIAEISNIPYIDFVYKGQDNVIEFLNKSQGLYISEVVLRNGIKGTPLIKLLNTIHMMYCKADLKNEKLYIWMYLNEIIFVPTKQDDCFCPLTLNIVSSAFYDKCVLL